MTAKEQLRLLVEGLTEEQGAELLRLLRGRVTPSTDDVRAARLRAPSTSCAT